MDETYLIPANSKKKLLIFGWFNTFDLILFCSGVALTLIFMIAMPIEDLLFAIIALLPAAISLLLVFPVQNYHNVLTVIMSTYRYFTTRRCFIWKGWCVENGEETSQK